jgi:serine/threonine protein kinase
MKLPTDGSFAFGTRTTYVPRSLISEGGFGSVWVLNNTSLVCKFGLADSALENEITVLNAIQKRLESLPGLRKYIHVPRIIESGICRHENNSMEYVVMERFGQDLSKIRDIHFSTELNRVYAVLRAGVQILKGLYSLHVYMKLVHGDVKPTNFLFRETETKKLSTSDLVFIDLGLARPVRNKNVTTSGINGTRSYASIHVQKKYMPTPRCDLESLGYMLLHFIDHALPWNREIKRRFKKNTPQQQPQPQQQQQQQQPQTKTKTKNETTDADAAAAAAVEAQEKTAKEKIALAHKRLLKQRIMNGSCASEGESILAEYFYAIYHMPIVPDTKTYKLLSGVLYDMMHRLQTIALETAAATQKH